MNKTNLTLLILAVVILAVAGAVLFSGEKAASPNEAGESAQNNFEKLPNMTLEDFSGNPVQLHDFLGKPLVINAWASWCPFCVEELKDFAAAQKEFSAEGGSASGGGDVIIVAIDRAESRKTAQGFTDKLGITDDLTFLLDREDKFYRSIGGFSMPETIFVNRDGEIILHKRGPMKLEEIREKIKSII